MSEYILEINLIVRIIFKLLPQKLPHSVIFDKTNLKFEQTNINILIIVITYQGLDRPLIYTLFLKRRNLSTQERIELMNRYIYPFSKGSIAELLAHREFIG